MKRKIETAEWTVFCVKNSVQKEKSVLAEGTVFCLVFVPVLGCCSGAYDRKTGPNNLVSSGRIFKNKNMHSQTLNSKRETEYKISEN